MDNLRTFLGTLSMLTSQTDEITRDFEVKLCKNFKIYSFKSLNLHLKNHKDSVINICIRLLKLFDFYSQIRSIDEVKITTVGFISILGNLRSVNNK